MKYKIITNQEIQDLCFGFSALSWLKLQKVLVTTRCVIFPLNWSKRSNFGQRIHLRHFLGQYVWTWIILVSEFIVLLHVLQSFYWKNCEKLWENQVDRVRILRFKVLATYLAWLPHPSSFLLTYLISISCRYVQLIIKWSLKFLSIVVFKLFTKFFIHFNKMMNK